MASQLESNLFCPLSRKIFFHPVKGPDNITYEKELARVRFPKDELKDKTGFSKFLNTKIQNCPHIKRFVYIPSSEYFLSEENQKFMEENVEIYDRLYGMIQRNLNDKVKDTLIYATVDYNYQYWDGNTLYMLLVQQGFHEICNNIIKTKEIKMDQTNNDGNNLLHIACGAKNYQLVQHLLDASFDINQPNKCGKVPLMLAMPDEKMMNLFLERPEIKFDMVDQNGDTCLIHSIEYGLETVATRILETGDSCPGKVNSYGDSALTYACKFDMEKLALDILKTGKANTNHITSQNLTPLIVACHHTMEDVALEIIKTGDCKPGHSSGSNTALMLACLYGMEKTAMALLETGESNPGYTNSKKESALQLACSTKMENVALKLIEMGEPKKDEGLNQISISPLILACIYNMETVAIALLKSDRCKLDVQNLNGDSALSLACMYNLREFALELVKSNKIPRSLQYTGDLALYNACVHKMEDVAMALIETGKVNVGTIQKAYNMTSLYAACHTKMKKVALALIKTGNSKPGVVTAHGSTALGVAVEYRMDDVAIAILETGDSNPNQIDNDGDTALTMACYHNSQNIIFRILTIQNLKNVTQINKNGHSALSYAVKHGAETIAIDLVRKGGIKYPKEHMDRILQMAQDKQMKDFLDYVEVFGNLKIEGESSESDPENETPPINNLFQGILSDQQMLELMNNPITPFGGSLPDEGAGNHIDNQLLDQFNFLMNSNLDIKKI